jgi:DNA integrity scanning protein DisA with diadenylate cyclase activity
MPFQISVIDIIDIFLSALIFFQIYRIIRGTAAFSIFITIFLIYLTWLLVRTLNMELTGAILGQVVGLGVLALVIVFQQEVRRFLLITGNRFIMRRGLSLAGIFSDVRDEKGSIREAEEIVKACESMSSKFIGALIVIGRKSSLAIYSEGGEMLKARISAELLETIFFKNTPLHDGAVLIEGGSQAYSVVQDYINKCDYTWTVESLLEEQKIKLEQVRKEFKKRNPKVTKEEKVYEFTMEQRVLLLKCMGYKTEDMNVSEIKDISSNITIDDLAKRWNEL